MEIKQTELTQLKEKENKTYTTHIESLNLESCLYATIIALMNPSHSFIISKPHRVSKKTIPFIKIREIINDEETIDIKHFMKQRGQDLIHSYQQQDFSLKTAQRRERSRRRMEMLFYLEDVLFLHGIDIHVSSSSMYGIYGPISISVENNCILETSQIVQIGKNVVEFVTQKMSHENEVLIDNNELQKFVQEVVDW